MKNALDNLLVEDPLKWIAELPAYQAKPLLELIEKGATLDDAAIEWIGASAATTAPFSANGGPSIDKNKFLPKLKSEFRGFICGDEKYKKEREGLFGEKAITRTFAISAIAVAISPYMGVAATVISPVVALLLSGLGKMTVNAWCATQPS